MSGGLKGERRANVCRVEGRFRVDGNAVTESTKYIIAFVDDNTFIIHYLYWQLASLAPRAFVSANPENAAKLVYCPALGGIQLL